MGYARSRTRAGAKAAGADMTRFRSPSQLEIRVRRAAVRAGLDVRPPPDELTYPYRADFRLGEDVLVLVHGCFWHGCPEHFRPPAVSRIGFDWSRKIERTRKRDAEAAEAYRALGFVVVVVWEHDARTGDELGALVQALGAAGRSGV